VRTSTVLVGLLGGAIFTGTLVPPLYVALPQRFVEDWYSVTSEAALIGLCLALAVVTLTGFVAASFAPDDGVRTGTVAGLLSALIGGVLVALPAAEIEACASLLSTNLNRALPPERLSALASETVLDGIWVPSAVGLALIAVGPALGAMGGVVFDLWRGTVSRTTRTIRLSWVPQVGMWSVFLGVVGASVWSAHLDKTVLPLLAMPASWGDRNALTAPLLVAGAFTAPLLAWSVRDAVLLLRERRRLAGAFWGTLAIAAPVASIAAAGIVHTAGLAALPPWVFVAACVTGGLAGLWDGSSSDVTFEPLPRVLGELLGEALLTGLLVACALVFVCGASTIGSYTIGFPYVRAVLESVPWEASRVDLVSRVFLLHWIAGLVIPVAGAVQLAVAVPLWMVGRLSGR
jgi:hypothetical protein